MKTSSGVTADCTGLEIGEYIDKKEKVIYYPIWNHAVRHMAKASLPPFLASFVPRFQQHALVHSRCPGGQKDGQALFLLSNPY